MIISYNLFSFFISFILVLFICQVLVCNQLIKLQQMHILTLQIYKTKSRAGPETQPNLQFPDPALPSERFSIVVQTLCLSANYGTQTLAKAIIASEGISSWPVKALKMMPSVTARAPTVYFYAPCMMLAAMCIPISSSLNF